MELHDHNHEHYYHEHEHDYEHEHIENKFIEAFEKYETSKSEKDISDAVNRLLDKYFNENFNPKVLSKIHGFIDITSLNSLDNKESIWEWVENKVNSFEGTRPDVPNVAAVCTYPLYIDTVKQALMAKDVKIASVAGGFPASQTFTEIKVAETAMAVMDGADEIDVVMNLGYFFEEDYESLTDELSEIKESCRAAKLKVILETGALKYVENIRKATILAVYSGADFVKTSTGKEFAGATPEAVYVMCKVLKKYYELEGQRVGIKVAGGIRSAEDAVKYYTIVKEILGKEWLNKDLFRIGASRLVDEIRSKIELIEN